MANTIIPIEPVAGRYHLLRRVGDGNMSTVYEAQDLRRGKRIVAVKMLNSAHDDAFKQEIFRRETRALSQLEHPNIVSVLDYGWSTSHSCHYLVFEYMPRTLLQEIAAHPDRRNHDWCWPLMRQMADALVHAHSQGVIHRDIKPSNVLLDDIGQSKFVDFGISLLKFELGTGVTVSSFFSIGYASPEQRKGEQATERSDIYSLGCVFYHMLARKTPPSKDFLTSEHIKTLQVYEPIKQILLGMLALDPQDRFADAVQLRRRLDVTHNLVLIPELYLLVTDRARRDLFDKGYIAETSLSAACTFLLQEFGEDDPKEVLVTFERDEIRLYTDTLRFHCSRDSSVPVLVVKTVAIPYQPQLEREKRHGVPFRFLWQVVASLDEDQIPVSLHAPLKKTLDSLFQRLSIHVAEEQIERQRKVERRDLTKIWEAVLSFQQERIEQASRLGYDFVSTTGDAVWFDLTRAAPDNLSWPENAPLAVFDEKKPQPMFVGHLIEIVGQLVKVSRDVGDTRRTLVPISKIPAPGFLTFFQQEAKVALDRQQTALSAIRDGMTHNPRLPEVLLDLSLAEFDEPDRTIEFVQSDLGEDKQCAVRQALAAHDLFLLQGPPGTGKTTTLAEIILQILKVKPDARILVASQSNVAVNHILSRISELQGSQRIEIVRIGRAEKIGHGAQVWTIEQRLANWRNEVLVRTEAKLAEIKAQMRKVHREQKSQQQQHAPALLDDLHLCQDWLEKLEEPLEELSLLEDEELERRWAELAETLELIRETLPEAARGVVLASLPEEAARLSKVIVSLLSPTVSDTREQGLLRLVKNWQKIFGKEEDFAAPLLERANILAATCLISGGYYLKDQKFDWAIIDEAGRATAPEILVSLVRARRAILVGDERQLPPMLDEDLSESDLARLGTSKEHLTESLFASLVAVAQEENLPVVQMLTMQHRMHPAIGQLVSSVFYGGRLAHAVDRSEREHQLPWLKHAVVWFSTTKLSKHTETPQGSSYYNRSEVRAISHLLHQMERTYEGLEAHREVAIITPYHAQIVELVAEISPESLYWRALSIEISTIDAFQGRDRDIVLYSTVRSNSTGQLGFLRDRRRLNVALSRAREALLIVGDVATLERGRSGKEGNPYQELIRYLRTHPEECSISDLDLEETHQ